MLLDHSMLSSAKIVGEIERLSTGRFEPMAVIEFVATFHRLVGASGVLGVIVQVSTDEGDELEIGCFTEAAIFDITLSQGKVYSCAYPLVDVKSIELVTKNRSGRSSFRGRKSSITTS